MKYSTKMRWCAILCAAACLFVFSPIAEVRAASIGQIEETVMADLTLGGLVSQEQIEEAGHIRVSERYADSLHTVDYENADGTHTVYLFQNNIKYRDGEKVCFIDTSLQEKRTLFSLDGYQTTGNRFTTMFHKNPADGVQFTSGTSSVTVKPLQIAGAVLSGVPSRQNNTVSFGKTAYTTTLEGYQAATVITRKAGETTAFSFRVEGDDVVSRSLVDENSVVFTLDNGDTVRYDMMGVYDTTGLPTEDTATVAIAQDTDGYVLTYTLSAADEAADNTEAVVTFAATVSEATAYETTTGSQALSCSNDAGIYNNTVPNYLGDEVIVVGQNHSYGTCRGYFQFDLSALADLNYDQVLSAHCELLEIYGAATPFQAECYMVTSPWEEETISWSSAPTNDSEKIFTANILYYASDETTSGTTPLQTSSYYSFYITKMVRGWLQGLPNYGFMIKERLDGTTVDGNTNQRCEYRFFISKETSVAQQAPKLIVTYTANDTSMDNIGLSQLDTIYIKNRATGTYLTATETGATLSSFTGALSQQWYLVGDGAYGATFNSYDYTIYSKAFANKRLAIQISSSGVGGVSLQTSQYDDATKFRFRRNWDGTYRIVCKAGDYQYALTTVSIASTAVCNAAYSCNWSRTDDWTVERVSKGNAYLMYSSEMADLDENGIDLKTSGSAVVCRKVEEWLDNSGYISTSGIVYTEEDAKAKLLNSDVWFLAAHGGTDGVQLVNQEGSCEYLTISDLTNMLDNSLRNTRISIWGGCSVGADDTSAIQRSTNLMGILYNYGAHASLACVMPVGPSRDQWIEEFFKSSEEGKTIYQAMCDADAYIYDYYNGIDVSFGNMNTWHFQGDSNACLCPGG